MTEQKCTHGTTYRIYCEKCAAEGLKSKATYERESDKPLSIEDFERVNRILSEASDIDPIEAIDFEAAAHAWEDVLPEGSVAPEFGSSAWRKERPIATGCLDYFPDALLEVAHVSLVGNKQHGNVELAWDKSKSKDEADALLRHLLQRGTVDDDGVLHSAKVAWRALALLQRELEAKRKSLVDL